MSKFGKWLLNATIGASVAEAPAVMTAAGFHQTQPNGDWDVNSEREGLEELRLCLVEIGIIGAGDMAAEALIATAAKYAPSVLSRVTPKLKRFARTITGETSKQAEAVKIAASEREARLLEMAAERARPGSDYISTVKDVNGNRIGFVDANGNVFGGDQKYIFNAVNEGQQSAFPGIQAAQSRQAADAAAASQIRPNMGTRSMWSYGNEAALNVQGLKDVTKGAAAVSGTAGLLGTTYVVTHKTGGILNYLDYVRN